MESVFEPAVRTEETPEARIVILDVPGFRKENLKVQVDKRGNLIISGERGAKEMEEMAKVGERLEKMQRFRKVIGIPPNLNDDGRITAKFKDQTLRISLPLRGHVSDQQNQDAIPASGTPIQPVQSKDERSCSAGHKDSIKEESGVAQDGQRPKHPEAIRQDDNKGKGSAAAEELKKLGEGRRTEAPKPGQDFSHGEPPISKDLQAVSVKTGAGSESQFIQSKSKQDKEKQEKKEADEAEEEKAENEDEIPEKQFPIACCPRRSRFFMRCCIVL